MNSDAVEKAIKHPIVSEQPPIFFFAGHSLAGWWGGTV